RAEPRDPELQRANILVKEECCLAEAVALAAGARRPHRHLVFDFGAQEAQPLAELLPVEQFRLVKQEARCGALDVVGGHRPAAAIRRYQVQWKPRSPPSPALDGIATPGPGQSVRGVTSKFSPNPIW